MSEKFPRFILQGIAMVCLTVLACLRVITNEALILLLGIIIRDLFSTAKEYQNKDDIKKDEEK